MSGRPAADLEHVSLFSGVGGIDLGMRAAGVPARAMCEIDKAARGVLADRFPGTHIYTDVKDVTGDSLRALGLNPRRTVVSAGFPCTDLSVAGGRRGMGRGTRSGLYWEVDRILGEFAPAWVVLENVPGLLSAACACPGDGTCVDRGLAIRCDGETHAAPGGACWGECIARHGGVMGAVLGSLAERGYGFAYRVLDARYFGVPQRRRRVVVVGRLGDDGRAPAQVLLEPEGVRGNPAEGIAPRQVFARRVGAGAGARGVLGELAHTLTAEGHDASEDGTGRGTPIVAAPRHAATLTAGVSRPGVSAPGRRQEDDHNVVAFHMTQDPISGAQSPAMGARSGGMGIAYAAEHTSTLQAGGGERGYRIDAESAAGGQLVATFQKVIRPATSDPQVIVRRLTPVECERLQGFPDNHTATSSGKPQADSPRYKQMGNAVAVPVFEWVAHRIAAVEGDRETVCEECGLVTPPGGVVLDPFSGSGTTGLAATKHGRRYVGIDLNADYLDLSLRTRLAQGVLIEGFQCIGIEREADYLPLITQRLSKPIAPVLDLGGIA